MTVVILGFGLVGQSLAMATLHAAYEILVLDTDENHIMSIVDEISDGKKGRGFDIIRNNSMNLSFSSSYLSLRDLEEIEMLFVATPTSKTHDAISYFLSNTTVKPEIVFVNSSINLTILNEVDRMLSSFKIPYAITPERIMEGSLFYNFVFEDKLVGAKDDESYFKANAILERLVEPGISEIIRCTPKEAVISKLAENSYRYWNIIFSNIVADICHRFDVDFDKVRESVNSCSERYMHDSGIGIGGNCLPENITHMARYDSSGVLENATVMHDKRVGFIEDWICSSIKCELPDGPGKDEIPWNVLFLGVAYRPEGKTTRDSIPRNIVSNLKGYFDKVAIYDPLVGIGDLDRILDCDFNILVIMQLSTELIMDIEMILEEWKDRKLVIVNLSNFEIKSTENHSVIHRRW